MKYFYIIVIGLLFVGCTSNKKIISTQAFKKAYEESKTIHSMKSYTLQKPKDDYICILKKEMSLYDKNRWNESEICAEIKNLDKGIKEELEL